MSGNEVCFYRKCLCVAGGLATQAVSTQTLLPPIPPPCTVSSGEAPVWFFAQRSSGLSPALPSFTHRSEESFQKSRIWPYRLLLTSTLTPAKWALLFLPLCLLSLSSSARQTSPRGAVSCRAHRQARALSSPAGCSAVCTS